MHLYNKINAPEGFWSNPWIPHVIVITAAIYSVYLQLKYTVHVPDEITTLPEQSALGKMGNHDVTP